MQVAVAMEAWKHESIFGDYINVTLAQSFSLEGRKRTMPGSQERFTSLQNILEQLQSLRPVCAGLQLELGWVEQLCDYVERLQASEPARTPEEQFNHLYVLRKWLHWVPVQLLQQRPVTAQAVLLTGYFYATALALESLFPDIGPIFCAEACLRPLEAVIQRSIHYQGQLTYAGGTVEIAPFLAWPRDVLYSYRQRHPWTQHSPVATTHIPQAPILNVDVAAYGTASVNPSPGFVPSQMHLTATEAHSRAQSPYLDVPGAQYALDLSGYSAGTGGMWGAFPSPSIPPTDFGMHGLEHQQSHESFGFEEEPGLGITRGGFVPTSIWT